MNGIAEAARKAHAWACYDCGKCTATCPITRAGGACTPRRHVLTTNLGVTGQAPSRDSLFACLTCGQCERGCPAQVRYTDLVLTLREAAFDEGVEPECPHGGALQSAWRMMARGGKQRRLEWLTPDLRTAPDKGEVFFWTGCTMYYDAFFSESGMKSLEGTKAAIKVLNHLGVTPVVSPDEHCCGHDLLWNGDRASFERLAVHNVKLVAESGATTLVVPCAECQRTWKKDYAPFLGAKPPTILHFSEWVQGRMKDLSLQATPRRVTFHDPCRLGRHLGVVDPPRAVLSAIPGLQHAEMAHHGSRSLCCAGGTWTNCDRYAKKVQVDRLKEARATGAAVMVTSCPKCQVHLRCAMTDPRQGGDIAIEMRDLAEIVAAALP